MIFQYLTLSITYSAQICIALFVSNVIYANTEKVVSIEKVLISPSSTVLIPAPKKSQVGRYVYSLSPAVKISPFLMQKYETTLLNFKQFIDQHPQMNRKKEFDDLITDSDDEDLAQLPVTNINWQQASDFCHFHGGRLPTQQEWVVAAGWVTKSTQCLPDVKQNHFYPLPIQYPIQQKNPAWQQCMQSSLNYNDEDMADMDWASLLSDRQVVSESLIGINGLYGMMGNVWEWTADAYDNKQSKYRIIKGGSYTEYQTMILYDSRVINFLNKESQQSNVGFRCAWDIKHEH